MSRSVLSLESTWLKIVGLAILLFCLLSIDYSGFSLSSSLSYPIALIIASIADTLILSYFVLFSRFNGWKLWVAVFSIFYVSNYVLTAVESVYLSSLLTASLVASILINGAVVSAVFGAALVIVLGKRAPAGGPFQNHLSMSGKQWIVRILGSTAVYLIFFILFGAVLYTPIAKQLDPTALAKEQGSIPASTAALVFPLEYLRGIVWSILAAVIAISLPFSWKKTGLVAGLLLAVPLSLNIFLSNTIVPGLQVAHFAELFGENLVFGFVAVWIFHTRIRELPPEQQVARPIKH